MKNCTSDFLFRKCYFVLYDEKDYPVCYFDSFHELSKCINYEPKVLAFRFRKYGNSVNILMGNNVYKLYAFVD